MIIIINFYLTGMRKSVLTFKEALGIFWYDRYKPIFESIINLTASIYLVQYFGMLGVFIGTTISTVSTVFWIEPYVLYKYGFKSTPISYFKVYLNYLIITIVTLFITLSLSSIFNEVNLVNFAIKTILCLLIPNVIYLNLFSKTREFQYLRNVLNNFIIKKLRYKILNTR